jgi:DNA-binding transcriptional LysR family regulator
LRFEPILFVNPNPGFEPALVRQSDRAQSILDLVVSGIGVSIVPEHFQRYKSDLVLRPLTPKPPRISGCMVWRKSDNSSTLRTFRGMVRRHFGQRSRQNA